MVEKVPPVRGLSLQENAFHFSSVKKGRERGVPLSDEERKWLLPHFTMLLVGKPGSGKTTVLEELLTNEQMYAKKFDAVFIVGPSVEKMNLSIPEQQKATTYNLDWVYSRISEINVQIELGVKKLQIKSGGTSMRPEPPSLGKASVDRLRALHKSNESASLGSSGIAKRAQDDFFKDVREDFTVRKALAQPAGGPSSGKDSIIQNGLREVLKKSEKQLKEEEERKNPAHEDPFNILFVFDDVISDIKARERDTRQTALFFNRRHLLRNHGTISLIIVTQKFTQIPARIRSVANWYILFRLNPVDFEKVYEDAIIVRKK